MKTRTLIITVGVIITIAIIFAISFEFPSQEHYEIKITGLKDKYLVGERYDFSYILSGFGDPCGGIHITFPINKTDSAGTGWIPSCLKTIPTDFVLDMKKTYGTTYGHITLYESGNYTVKITFEKGSNGPTVAEKNFLVVSTDNDLPASNSTLLGGLAENGSLKISESQIPSDAGLQVKVTGLQQVRRGTTHDITVDVIRDGNPVFDSLVRITIEDYGQDIIREFEGRTDGSGRFVFSWEIPKSFDDVETLLAYVDVTDDISAKTVLFKFQVYCLPGESGCKIEGN